MVHSSINFDATIKIIVKMSRTLLKKESKKAVSFFAVNLVSRMGSNGTFKVIFYLEALFLCDLLY